ncbi:hypothetical protein PG994_005697 [Apiospora phragmitis]|uniref:Uncharacterized protein n=1 Tax=Apiospora phragmitis TaxID=2905665 RepID=A0ABR1VFJ3_9PEZI
MSVYRMPARTMTSDGKWYCFGAPSIHVMVHDSYDPDDWFGKIRYMTNREWCYYAECDLIIFAHLVGDVVVTPEDQEKKMHDEAGEDEDEEDDYESTDNTVKEIDDVTNWPQVLEKMEYSGWAFDMEELEEHWKKSVVPRIRATREANARRKKDNKSNGHRHHHRYNALAGLAAACHTRNVDPADHPHGYGKHLPTPSELYLERICQEFGGKSAEVIREQEEALKQGLQLKKVKRGDGGGEGGIEDDGDLVMGDS